MNKVSCRYAACAAICLIFGVVLTIVSAWSCMLINTDTVANLALPRPVSTWPVEVPERWPAVAHVQDIFYRGWHRVIFSSQPRAGEMLSDFYINIDKFGWPCTALSTIKWRQDVSFGWDTGSSFVATQSVWKKGVEWGTGISPPPHPLPILPVLPGFIVDSLIFATLPMMVFAWPMLRRRFRRSRRRCASCGYDLSGIRPSRCPECGAETARTAEESGGFKWPWEG